MKLQVKTCAAWTAVAAVCIAGVWYFVHYLVAGQSIIFVSGAAATLAIAGALAPKPPDGETDKP